VRRRAQDHILNSLSRNSLTVAEGYGEKKPKERPVISEEDRKFFKEWEKDYALARLRDKCKKR